MIAFLSKHSPTFYLLALLFIFIQTQLYSIEYDIHQKTKPIKEQIDRPEIRKALTESHYHNIRLKLESLNSPTVMQHSFLFKHIYTITFACLLLGSVGALLNFAKSCRQINNPLNPNS